VIVSLFSRQDNLSLANERDDETPKIKNHTSKKYVKNRKNNNSKRFIGLLAKVVPEITSLYVRLALLILGKYKWISK
jgi:hypothetical protein